MMRSIYLLLIVALAGCTVPTEPTPSGFKEWMEPDTMRVVTEVDGDRMYQDPVDGSCPVGSRKVLRYAVWARGDERMSDQFKVPKCERYFGAP